jgi:hypothetical protein
MCSALSGIEGKRQSVVVFGETGLLDTLVELLGDLVKGD